MSQRTSAIFDQWPRRATNIPTPLENWAIEQGLIHNRWMEILAPESFNDADIFPVFEDRLCFVIEAQGYRYYAGESTDTYKQQPTCYWLGLSV
jgi:hypothetical protein